MPIQGNRSFKRQILDRTLRYYLPSPSRAFNKTVNFLGRNVEIIENITSTTSYLFNRACCCSRRRKLNFEKIEDEQKQKSNSPYPILCKNARSLLDGIAPRLLSDLVASLPGKYVAYQHYMIGAVGRHFTNKFDEWTGFVKWIKESPLNHIFYNFLYTYTSNTSRLLLGNGNLNPLNNHLERLLQEFSVEISLFSEKISWSDLTKVMINSLSPLLEEISAFNEAEGTNYSLDSEWSIALLDYLAQKEKLPKGFPNPRLLTKENFDKLLDESMELYLKELSNDLLAILAPPGLQDHALYWLEIRGLLRKALISALGSGVIKKLSTPHELFITLLYGFGYECCDLEVSAFGRELDPINKLGHAAINQMLSKRNLNLISQIFTSASLQEGTGGREQIAQKRIARQLVNDKIVEITYGLFKQGLPASQDSWYKFLRKKAKQLPLVGHAVTALHCAIHTTLYTINSYQRDEETSIPLWVAKNLSSREIAQEIVTGITTILEHPMWRIILMQLLEDIRQYFNKIHKKEKIDFEEKRMGEKCGAIANFLIIEASPTLSHAAKQVGVTASLNNFLGEAMASGIDSIDFPSFSSWLTNFFTQTVAPNLNEQILYNKVTTLFRRRSCYFHYDAKFWEIWIRNHLVAWVNEENLLQRLNPSPDFPFSFPSPPKEEKERNEWLERSQQSLISLRHKRVKQLLALKGDHFLQALVTPQKIEERAGYLLLPPEPPPKIKFYPGGREMLEKILQEEREKNRLRRRKLSRAKTFS